MSNIIKDIVSQFTKRELHQIGEEFGMRFSSDTRSSVIVPQLVSQATTLLADGKDHEFDDLAFEFLQVAELIGEEGDLLAEGKEAGSNETLEELKALLECYTFADKRDPSCIKCKVFESCMTERLMRRPKCFGNPGIYDSSNEECQLCLEFVECGNIIKKEK